MKKLIVSFIVVVLSSITTFAETSGAISGGGDCMPTYGLLPNWGENCDFVSEFKSANEVGKGFEIWTCVESNEAANYLIETRETTTDNPEFMGCDEIVEVIKATKP